MIQHDPRCDQQHTPRQRCNDRMEPASARIARLAAESIADAPSEARRFDAEPPASRSAAEESRAIPDGPEPELEPSPVREAVTTIEPPEPTVFVSREWNDTTAAVEQVYRGPAAPPSRSTPQPDGARNAAIIGLALAFALLLLVRLAHRSSSRR
jgi:hypothetical protein